MTDKSFVQTDEEKIFTLDDVKRLFIKLKKNLLRAFFLGGILAFLSISLKVPQYKAEATFREENENKANSVLQDFMGGMMGGAAQSQASTFMKSFQVLKPLIETLGLQVGVPKKGFILGKVYRRIRDNWRAERGYVLQDPDMFVFKDVSYAGDDMLSYTLRFQDPDHFTILDGNKPIVSGIVGSPITTAQFALTLAKPPSDLKIGTYYSLHITSWLPIAKSLRAQLRIANSKSNESILELGFSHRDRRLAAQLLNELMAQYQRYLKSEHDRTSLGQLEYLSHKKDQIYGQISDLFQEHATYLKRSLETKGIAGLKDEMQTLLIPYQKFQQKVLAIDVELSRLNQMEKEESVGSIVDEGPFSSECRKLVCQIQELKQARDLLEISFQQDELLEDVEDRLTDRQAELQAIRDKRDRLKCLLQPDGLFAPEDSLALWANHLSQEDRSHYVVNYMRLLSVQEKMVQEKCLYAGEPLGPLDAIDLDMARSLFIEYNSKRDASETVMKYYQQLIDKIEEHEFEISSLSSVLKDPLSQNLIAEANKVAVQLKDEKYHSLKEGERWKEELLFQKKILKEHLGQLYQIEKLGVELSREKMIRLQQVSLGCINREISVLYERISDSFKERKTALLQEKKIIEQKMEELRHVSADFPEKWRQEKWLDLNTQMGLKMMEVVTRLVEEKTVAEHLHHVESRPLDSATLPLLPNKPGLFMAVIFGALASGFVLFLIFLLRAVISGFPTTLERLKALKYPTLGQISSSCDGPLVEPATGEDLELLRGISLFIDNVPQAKIIGLIGGKGPDYSYALAENFARISRKSLVIRCDFESKFNASDLPGLLQIWNREINELPLRKEKGFDWISAGGFSLHGMEMIQSKFFSEFLESLRSAYDFIFILFRSSLTSAESAAALRLCDKAIVTISGEPIEALAPFTQWACHDGRSRLTYVVSDKI